MHTLKLWLKTLQLGAFDCIFYNNGPAAEHIAMHCELGKVPFESELYNRGPQGPCGAYDMVGVCMIVHMVSLLSFLTNHLIISI